VTRRRQKRRPAPILVVHGVSVEAWTKRHGVTPFTSPCGNCGRVLTTSIPFVRGTLRGLMSPSCECGAVSLAEAESMPPNQRRSITPYGLVRDSRVGDLFDNGGSLLS
jgi:hypothetical protein